MINVPAVLLDDNGWRAALYILTSAPFRDDPLVWKHVDLVRLNGGPSVNLYQLVHWLSDEQGLTVVHAIMVSRFRNFQPKGGLLHQ